MAKFELFKVSGRTRKRVGDAFHSAVDPLNEKACAQLLKDQADAAKIPRSEAELVAYPKGRSPKRYRA